MNRFDTAAEIYKNYGIDAQKAIDTLKNVTVSMHCWQGDDVVGLTQRKAFRAVFRQRETIRAKRALLTSLRRILTRR